MREPKEGKWTIKRGDISMIGIIKPLIPFNCIVDTDAGLIDLIRTDYRSPDMFNIGLLDSFKNGNELLKFLYERTVINPIIPFMNNPEDEDTAKGLLEEAPVQEENMSFWWLLLIALLGEAGREMYMKHKKKQEEKAKIED